jgi:signal transduction histidine kinase/CheY-like chemotaxis protein
LKGIDQEWSLPSAKSSVSYPLLPPGKYEFRVRARIAGQAWGESSEALAVQVMKPFYFRWWFVMSALIVLILSVYLMLQIRFRKINAQRSVLEATVLKRTDELNKTNVQIVKQKDELEFHKNHLEELVSIRTSELELAKLKAEESSRLKTAFLANMSHEIRTPLNSIVNFSQLLFDDRIDDDERKNFKDIVENSSNSLLRLIEDILDIARLEAGELNIEIESCDIAGLIGRLHEIYYGKIRLNNLNLKLLVSIPESYAGKIETDAIRLNQILINLLDNAFKFTDQGEIEFGFVEEIDSLKFFVRDSGIGIADANLERVFERFTKIEENRRKVFPGAGLGLAIAKRLVFLLEGDIWAESAEGYGSVFFFRIPKKVNPVDDLPPELPTIKFSFDWSNYTILVVEDEFSNAEVLRAFLSPTAAKVIYVEDGNQAVECLKNDSSIDLILMDLKLPVMDGVEATQRIRTFNTDIPIIAQTAFGVSHERVGTLKCGFNDYVTKPLNRDRLLNSMDHYLKRK